MLAAGIACCEAKEGQQVIGLSITTTTIIAHMTARSPVCLLYTLCSLFLHVFSAEARVHLACKDSSTYVQGASHLSCRQPQWLGRAGLAHASATGRWQRMRAGTTRTPSCAC